MSATMRAKMQVVGLEERGHTDGTKSNEILSMSAVAAPKYDETGMDEDNTFAKFSPAGNLTINIANPALWGKFALGDKFYVDFTPATEAVAPAPAAQ